MELFSLFLYPLLFFVLFASTNNKRLYPCYLSTLALYFLAGVTCLVFYSIQQYKSPVSPVAIFYHIIMLGLLINPIKKYDRFAYEKCEIIQEKKLKPFVYVLIAISLYSIYDSFQNITVDRILTDVQSIRAELAENGNYRGGMSGYITYYARIYWSLALLLMFYYLVYYPQKKLLILLLFISSLSQVIESFTIAGRDIVLKYIFIFLILNLLFRNELPQSTKRALRKVFVLTGSLFVGFFALISALRWDLNDTASMSTQEALIAYLGQPFLYFSEYFENFAGKGATNGAIHFPIFTKTMVSRFNLADSVNVNMMLNTFSTSIGTWLFETGAFIAAIITVIHSLFMQNLKRKRKTIFSLIYIIWVFEFIFFSLFYYVYTINLSFVASILFIKMLEVLSNSRKTVINH